MAIKRNEELERFFAQFNRKCFVSAVDKLVFELSKVVDFNIKLKQSSIQLLKKNQLFAACGFRRNKDYFYVSFHSDTEINNKKAMLEKTGEYYIYRSDIVKESDVDTQLIEWIRRSYELN